MQQSLLCVTDRSASAPSPPVCPCLSDRDLSSPVGSVPARSVGCSTSPFAVPSANVLLSPLPPLAPSVDVATSPIVSVRSLLSQDSESVAAIQADSQPFASQSLDRHEPPLHLLQSESTPTIDTKALVREQLFEHGAAELDTVANIMREVKERLREVQKCRLEAVVELQNHELAFARSQMSTPCPQTPLESPRESEFSPVSCVPVEPEAPRSSSFEPSSDHFSATSSFARKDSDSHPSTYALLHSQIDDKRVHSTVTAMQGYLAAASVSDAEISETERDMTTLDLATVSSHTQDAHWQRVTAKAAKNASRYLASASGTSLSTKGTARDAATALHAPDSSDRTKAPSYQSPTAARLVYAAETESHKQLLKSQSNHDLRARPEALDASTRRRMKLQRRRVLARSKKPTMRKQVI